MFRARLLALSEPLFSHMPNEDKAIIIQQRFCNYYMRRCMRKARLLSARGECHRIGCDVTHRLSPQIWGSASRGKRKPPRLGLDLTLICLSVRVWARMGKVALMEKGSERGDCSQHIKHVIRFQERIVSFSENSRELQKQGQETEDSACSFWKAHGRALQVEEEEG